VGEDAEGRALSDRVAIVVGKGGHAHVIASLLPHARVRFLVPDDPGPDDLLQSDFFAGPALPDADYYIGIGDNAVRRSYFDRLKAVGLTISNCIAPTAWTSPDAQLGEGLFIGSGAVVCARTRIGDNVIVNTLSSVDHDCDIGADTQITPGVTFGSHLVVGRSCFFGMKSCLIPRLTLGDRVVVMAGSLVVRSAPDDVMLGGSPARIMRGGQPS
jgi:sugar O-acyltransferase (sialic acid O-acetyltransferase NeuD family)